jgi:hypothetical protein
MTDDISAAPSDRPAAAAPSGWGAAPTPAATPWYGTPTPTPMPTPAPRTNGPKPPWFWPVIAAVVGLAALLAGGGIGFTVGHAIGGSHQTTTRVPGTNGGTDELPGGGTGQFPGNGTRGGTGTGTGSGSGTGSDTSGSASDS